MDGPIDRTTVEEQRVPLEPNFWVQVPGGMDWWNGLSNGSRPEPGALSSIGSPYDDCSMVWDGPELVHTVWMEHPVVRPGYWSKGEQFSNSFSCANPVFIELQCEEVTGVPTLGMVPGSVGIIQSDIPTNLSFGQVGSMEDGLIPLEYLQSMGKTAEEWSSGEKEHLLASVQAVSQSFQTQFKHRLCVDLSSDKVPFSFISGVSVDGSAGGCGMFSRAGVSRFSLEEGGAMVGTWRPVDGLTKSRVEGNSAPADGESMVILQDESSSSSGEQLMGDKGDRLVECVVGKGSAFSLRDTELDTMISEQLRQLEDEPNAFKGPTQSTTREADSLSMGGVLVTMEQEGSSGSGFQLEEDTGETFVESLVHMDSVLSLRVSVLGKAIMQLRKLENTRFSRSRRVSTECSSDKVSCRSQISGSGCWNSSRELSTKAPGGEWVQEGLLSGGERGGWHQNFSTFLANMDLEMVKLGMHSLPWEADNSELASGSRWSRFKGWFKDSIWPGRGM